jgi:hypothetical protein
MLYLCYFEMILKAYINVFIRPKIDIYIFNELYSNPIYICIVFDLINYILTLILYITLTDSI